MTSVPTTPDIYNQGRYSSADFYRLTNGHSPSPRSPDFEAAGGPPAESTNNRHENATADSYKRPIFSRRASPCNDKGCPPSDIRRQNSYSSVKEDGRGVAQSFLESIVTQPSTQDPGHDVESTSPRTGPCSCCCRCSRIREWKSPGSRGKWRSKSYSPSRTGVSELPGWDWEPLPQEEASKVDLPKSHGSGEAPLERLPTEILDNIISQLAIEVPPVGYTPRNADLVSCLLTSRTIHAATITVLYNHITIPHSLIFSKFLGHISRYPALGTIVRRLDLSHFTSIGLGRTRQSNAEIQNLTSKTLLECLQLTPFVQEVLLQENVDDDIDESVLRKLFFGLPALRALDFCAASSTAFVDAFSAALQGPTASLPLSLGIRRLSLHECFTLQSSVIESLLSRLDHLTHLDVCHTRVTDKALASIPKTATLSHLNLGRCSQVSGEGVVDFLTTHPAVANLVYLNLCCDTSRYRLLREVDVERLLPSLPSCLRSLNLNGAKLRASHQPLLLPLTKHLEELSIGYAELSMRDINALFVPRSPSDDDGHLSPEEANWMPSTLHYLDLTGITSVTQSSLFSSACVLLHSGTCPLEVLELGDKAISGLRECRNTNKRLGWVVKELGRRGWYVREPTQEAQNGTRGRRDWKMGAMWWGMRKVPVAYGEVGGLYGHYMFKK